MPGAAYLGDGTFNQACRSLEILRRDCVVDGIVHCTMLLIPIAGAPVQRGNLFWQIRHQMHTKDLSEEVVIAIPMAPVIERNDKEIAALEGLQPRLAVLLARDGIAEGSTQPVENGRLEQEAADWLRLALKNLFHQVVHNIPVVPGKRPDEAMNVLAVLHRKCG